MCVLVCHSGRYTNRKSNTMLAPVTPEDAEKMIDVIDSRLDETPFGHKNRPALMEAKMFYLSILVNAKLAK